jgi:hypothetical protein
MLARPQSAFDVVVVVVVTAATALLLARTLGKCVSARGWRETALSSASCLSEEQDAPSLLAIKVQG